ncbi:MAG: hypothetical protein AB3N11_13700, partial [Arenibacterium sp.]
MSGVQKAIWLASLMICASLIAGCVEVPEFGDRVSPALDQSDYPALVPIVRLLGAPTPPGETAETIANQLNARRDGLRRRADALQGAIIDPDTR